VKTAAKPQFKREKSLAPAVVELKEVSKAYTMGDLEVEVLKHINVTIRYGEMVAIMGPSGSGKSTLMNIIGLLDRPTSGTLRIDQQELSLNLPDARLAALRSQKIGFVFQSFNLLPKMSALSNVLIPTTYYRSPVANPLAKARDLLEQLGLQDRASHKPSELSGGEKQRVAIARALINDPEIILADEPTGNLDTKSGKEMLDILHKLNMEGKTVVLVTHDLSIAARCKRTINVLDGRIVSDTLTDNHKR